jgi:hypothetical protein
MHRTSDSISCPLSAAEPVGRTPGSSEEARPCLGSRSIVYSLLVAAALLALALATGASPASASNGMKLGLFDDAATIGAPDVTFPVLQSLDVQVVRM